MSGLMPTELHRYSIRDVVHGMVAARKPVESQTTISLPGLGNGIPVRSARAAVIVALKALGMPPGSRIGVPLYCCPVVFKAIKAADCVPRFLDIDPETFCISLEDLRAKRSGIDVLMAVHMFGNLCDMPKILEIIEGKPVIEDCAQSIGSKLDGRACGSFGDISFFSFRSGKYLSVGEGGALYSGKTDLRARISELTAALPVPTRAEEMKHIMETYIRSKLRSQPLWGLVGSRIWAVYNRKTEFADKSPIVISRIFASDLATVRRRMPRLDSMIASQRANAEYFEHNLQLDPRMLCLERPRAYSNRFMYPIILPSTEQRDMIATYLRDRGVGTSRPYEEVITGAAEHYGYEGDCPSAERTLRRTLVIPSFYTLKPKDIRYIVRNVNQGYSSSGEDPGTFA
ncbi:MAG: DegT/DnrJ/EryC1/StrS family aminotransferase [Candidatus Aminicenantales bacterium]